MFALKAAINTLASEGVNPGAIMGSVMAALGPEASGMDPVDQHFAAETQAVLDHMNHKPMHQVIARLLAERSPEVVTPAGVPQDAMPQTPAMQCQIFLRSGYKAEGVLSTTPEGTLRFLSMGKTTQHGPPDVLIEHFFDYGDVESVVIPRKIERTMPIVTGR